MHVHRDIRIQRTQGYSLISWTTFILSALSHGTEAFSGLLGLLGFLHNCNFDQFVERGHGFLGAGALLALGLRPLLRSALILLLLHSAKLLGITAEVLLADGTLGPLGEDFCMG